MDNKELFFKRLLVEDFVRKMVLRGIDSNRELIEAVDREFRPKTLFEQEMLSETIIYAKYGVLN